jgi:hypothetical protein
VNVEIGLLPTQPEIFLFCRSFVSGDDLRSLTEQLGHADLPGKGHRVLAPFAAWNNGESTTRADLAFRVQGWQPVIAKAAKMARKKILIWIVMKKAPYYTSVIAWRSCSLLPLASGKRYRLQKKGPFYSI